VKAGFLLGGNYGEGYLIRDGEVMALVDISGGNLGLQAGGQTYAQVTYILSEQKYTELLNKNRVSISGNLAYGRNGHIETSILTSDVFARDLYTVVLDETGTIFGASFEGLYYTVRK
jgi:lipid-binding SYLF domain-containing protein